MPIQARSPVSPKGIRRLSSSNELGAQYVSPHQTTKRKKTTPERRVPAFSQCLEMMSLRQLVKNGVSGGSERPHSVRNAILKGSQGTARAARIPKTVHNRKADCCTLLKRITKLKCVNSEFRTVNTHPEEGCLKWLHGTMSEPPWKSH